MKKTLRIFALFVLLLAVTIGSAVAVSMAGGIDSAAAGVTVNDAELCKLLNTNIKTGEIDGNGFNGCIDTMGQEE